MKRCPTCQRTYANDDFSFCLADGTLLSAPYDPKQTLILPTPDNPELPTLNENLNDAGLSKELTPLSLTGKRRRWSETSFFDEAAKNLSPYEVGRIKHLYRFSVDNADRVRWGTGSQTGSFNVIFNSLNSSKSLYTVYSNGNLDLNFSWLYEDERVALYLDSFADKLNGLRDFDIPYGFEKRFVRVSKEAWMTQVDDFIKILQSIFQLN